MSERCHLCWVAVFIACAFSCLLPVDPAQAQFNNGETDTQQFNGPIGVRFNVAPYTFANFSFDGGCSAGTMETGRADGSGALFPLMPPGTGTRMVKDLNPGPGSSTIGSTGHSGIDTIYHMFLSADDGRGTQGQEFYRVLNGLYPVMQLVKDINPGPAASSNPSYLTHQTPGGQGKLYFSADDGTNGRELWLSHTAPEMTSTEFMVKDINPGPGSSDPEGFGLCVNATNKPVIFSANDGTSGRELWASYGTGTYPDVVHTTVLLKDINSAAGTSSSPQLITTLTYNWSTDSKVFFTADDGINGRELWRTDGTVENTGMLKDIVPGAGSSNPTNLTPVHNITGALYQTALFFTAGNNLWITMGALSGVDTTLIKDVGGSPSNLTVVPNPVETTGNTLYFTVGNDLWKSDRTPAGTVVVKTFASPPSDLASCKSTLFFAANDGTGAGIELWRSDATGTSMVKDINPGTASSSPTNLRELGSSGILCFSANDGVSGRELWKTKGTAGDTLLVKDINPGSASSDPANPFLFDFNERLLFFTANDGAHGRELWESDGFAEASQNHLGWSYKWDLEALIKSKGDASKIAVAGTDKNIFTIFWSYDFAAMGGASQGPDEPIEGGLSEAAHEINDYVEITDGADRAPLNITYVDCGDGNLPRPRAALTDGNYHNVVAFGMVAALDQDPCDTDSRGPASPGVPYAHVPAVYDGHDWIPMDRLHFAPGVPTNPPTGASLAQQPSKWLSWNASNPGSSLPALVPAETDPMQTKRYGFARIDVLTDYIFVSWTSKQTEFTWVATLPRHYKGAFKALYFGNKACLQPAYPFYFDQLSLSGGLFATSTSMYSACCTPAGCTNAVGKGSCPIAKLTLWKTCADPSTPICCPTPWADSDWDGDVDMDDFAKLQKCLTSGGGALLLNCTCFDPNGDKAITLTDINKFVTCGTGPNVAVTPEQAVACDTWP